MITVFARRINGKGEKMLINSKTSTKIFINQVSKILNCSSIDQSHSNIQCYFRGVKLVEGQEQNIDDIGMVNNSIVHVVEKVEADQNAEIHIKLIIKNKLFEYEIGGEFTVQDLKQTICQDLQIKEEDLTLSYLGVELIDSKVIKQYSFPQGVLLSALVSSEVASQKLTQNYSISKESYSQESESIPKIVKREDFPARKKIKKAESLNVQPMELKNKNINFSSVRLNKIQQKNDESKIESQINQSEEISEETSQIEEINPLDWQKPKLTLDALSKPWYGDQKIIETESIVGDQDSEQTFSDCFLELTRVDKKRQYMLECSPQHTFEDAVKTLARLEKVEPTSIKLLLSFDEVSKSGISSQSSKGIQRSPKSSESLKRQRSSHEGGRLSIHRHQGMKTKIMQKAAKSKIISIEYEILRSN